MSDGLQQRIKETTATAMDWQVADIRVDEVPQLRQGACSFFIAAQTRLLVSTRLNFAALASGQLLDGLDKNAAEQILRDCGAGAGPEWQAEILSRFHPAIHGVVVTEQQGGAVRKIKAKGKVFGPPAVIDGVLNFYVVEPEANIVSQVKATLGDTVQVEVTQL